MRFGASRSQLYDAQKTARGRWDETADAWTDQTRRDFGDRVWEPLDQRVVDVLRGIDQLSSIFAQVRQECEFRPEE
ncbi:MAG: hypothetical protein ACRC7O_13825 [Fimbriiglobus sp.]